jgi:hypothetical protein
MKRIISFSLWGTDPKYLVGAVENAKLQKEVYPDWTCRFYLDQTIPEEIINKLTSLGSEIVHRQDSNGYRNMFWRFEPAFDTTIERFIVRDCDSRLSYREATAVQEWIESDLPFHIIRDHDRHDVIILGGLWGAKSGFIPEFKTLYLSFLNYLDTQKPFFKRAPYFYADQIFLTKKIWPMVKDRHMAHDDKARFTGNERPFLVAAKDGTHIGQQYGADNNPLKIPI